ncbi:hypothetical protein ACP3TJ_05235 [Desulforudis sp. 1088]|uniref:hypothetical protein n=1 Tax=unclassified Candidatus Desulforudis TaxID=2635950 RepID=UPI003CE58DF8
MTVLQHYREALDKHRWQLMLLPNVVGVGVGFKRINGEDTGQEALVVFVSEKVPEETLPRAYRIPRRIEGLPTDVVSVGEIRLLGERVARKRPASPGVSIGHYRISAGTFGAVVYDSRSGEPLILSNNHILANNSNGKDHRARCGDPILQPGPYDGGTKENDAIGSLYRFAPLHYSVKREPGAAAARYEPLLDRLAGAAYRPPFRWKYQRYVFSRRNFIDAALARPVDLEAISPEILDVGMCTSTGSPAVGMLVKKSGRTTGLTHGEVRYLHSTIFVQISKKAGAVFEDQIICSSMSSAGDSGSLVVDEDNRAIGLLFAGSAEVTAANSINYVTRLLGVQFAKQEG